MNISARITTMALTMLVCGAPPSRTEAFDELYQKARAEGALVFYAGGPAAPHERRVKDFLQRFPGITVSVTGGFSNVLNQRIAQQMKDAKLELDMAFFQTVQDFVAWKRQGVLLPFKPEGFEQIMPSFRDADGAYMAMSANVLTYAYNTKLVRADDGPRSALDFLKPMFRGKLISVYPHDDDAALYLFYLIVQKYGWDYMDRYMTNQPNFIQGHLPVARSVASGENMATLDASSAAWQLKRAGEPIEVVFSSSDKSPVFTLTGGIFKDAPHPNAAKLYLSWFLSKEQQSRLGTFSSRVDVPPPEGLGSLTSYDIANDYREFMTNEALVADLRRRFEAYTGPAVNRGGVR
jgi:ABC-type Fe3+ transport system substrate-binding protein